jgi:hypothetical protein
MFKSRYDYRVTIITPRSAGLPQVVEFHTSSAWQFWIRSMVAGWHIAVSGLWAAAHTSHTARLPGASC